MNISKIIVGGIGTLVASSIIYALNEARKQYDTNVKDYNNLVDKYNELAEFIDNHDFYQKEKTKPSIINEYKDPNSGECVKEFSDGFKLITFGWTWF